MTYVVVAETAISIVIQLWGIKMPDLFIKYGKGVRLYEDSAVLI